MRLLKLRPDESHKQGGGHVNNPKGPDNVTQEVSPLRNPGDSHQETKRNTSHKPDMGLAGTAASKYEKRSCQIECYRGMPGRKRIPLSGNSVSPRWQKLFVSTEFDHLSGTRTSPMLLEDGVDQQAGSQSQQQHEKKTGTYPMAPAGSQGSPGHCKQSG